MSKDAATASGTDEGKAIELLDGGHALKTREVFLDTQAYRKVEFVLDHPTMAALFKHVDESRLRLHTTDITLREILRQVLELAEKAAREVERVRDILKRWKSRAPLNLADVNLRQKGLDGRKMGNELFATFRKTLQGKNITEHEATARNALPIFQAYFDRKPPFDGENSKEFPDAFVIDALASWCENNRTLMYVVTGDKAMLRAAAACPYLLPVANLTDLLSAATVDHDPDVEATVLRLAGRPQFGADLEALVDDEIGNVGLLYIGDMAEGDAVDAKRTGPCANLDWTVISADADRYGLIVSFDAELTAEVEYEDRDTGFYDREDGRYYGAEDARTEVVDDVGLRMFVEIDGEGAIVRHEMLTRDVEISDYSPY